MPIVQTRRVSRQLFRDRWTFPLLLLLTLIAGVLRFTALDRPTAWGDEAATYGRVAGSYDQLLAQLSNSAFPPLHYELEWWIGRGMPYWGRFEPPETDGGPKKFVPTKFIIGSADGANIRLTPFALRFIPAVAGTLFVPAVFFVAVQLFGRRVALWTAMLACFSAYLLVYSRDAKMYMHFWLATTFHAGCLLWWVRTRRLLPWSLWVFSGVIAVGLHGSGFVMLLVDALVVFVSPSQNWRHLWTLIPVYVGSLTLLLGRIAGWVGLNRDWKARRGWQRVAVWQRRAVRRFRWPVVIGFGIGVWVIWAAAFGDNGYYSAFSRRMQQIADRDSAQVDTGELGIGWVTRYNDGRTLADYLLYTASAYLTGWEWPRPVDQERGNLLALRLLQGGTLALLTMLTVGVVPWRKLFAANRARLDRITQTRGVWRPFVRRRAWWVAIWLTAVPWVVYTQSHTKPATVLNGVADVLLKKSPAVDWPRARWNADADVAIKTRLGDAWQDFTTRWSPAWQTYRAAWTRDNLSTPAVVVFALLLAAIVIAVLWKRRAVGRGTLQLALLALVLVTLGTIVAAMPRKADGDLWMPRYIATMLPAFLIVVAVLIDRLPRLIRWATLVLFVAVNLSQFTGRLLASEPPTGLIAADVVAAQPKSIVGRNPEQPLVRSYFNFGWYMTPEPGGGTLFSQAGRYYLRLLSGVDGDVFGVLRGGYERALQLQTNTDPNFIERDISRLPSVSRVIIWTALPMGQVDQVDDVAAKLKGTFRRVNEETWIARDHWRWIERFQVRRRTYERVAPTTRPAK
ncbi:MAG: hypothetical protein QM754_01035 [Tepidisphaeraceae bacterium]